MFITHGTLNGNSFYYNLIPGEVAKLLSCDVEHSFNDYKNML